MRATLLTLGDDLVPKIGASFEYSEAHDLQFLNPDKRCQLQLRRLLTSDMPPGTPLHGATALLVVRAETGAVTMVFTIRADRTRIRNTRAGVLHALNCLERLNPGLARGFRAMALKQTVWGEDEPHRPALNWPPPRTAKAKRPRR